MLHATAQERRALAVVALLLAAGVGVRLGGTPAEASWTDAAGPVSDTAAVHALRGAVAAQVQSEQLRATPLAAGETLDLNTAPAEQLDRLPRVGPALARRIVEHRQAHGPFRSLDALTEVRGVGPALLESARPYLRVPAGAAAPGPAAARVRLNRADAAELQALPGIGPALAERILADRVANGPVRSPEQLQRVRGVGPVLAAKLEPLLDFRP